MSVKVIEWKEPPAMDTGAPLPVALRKDERLWIAYICSNPEFPGWDSGKPQDHPGFEVYSAVLQFEGVVKACMGWPNDEDLDKHPLYSAGLSSYGFYEITGTAELAQYPGCRHWIITFHDETLEVVGRSASVLSKRSEGERTNEIAHSYAEPGSTELEQKERPGR